eukprot:gene3759-253_t
MWRIPVLTSGLLEALLPHSPQLRDWLRARLFRNDELSLAAAARDAVKPPAKRCAGCGAKVANGDECQEMDWLRWHKAVCAQA